MPELVTLGETCVALVAKSGGPLRYCAEFERRPGGAESTVAAGVAKLGHTAGWISQLGNDEFGRYILSVMRGEDVDVSNVRIVDNAPTGVFFRENRPFGGSAVFYYRKDSAFSGMKPEDLNDDYIASARVLHLTGITLGLSASCRAVVEHAIDVAAANGVTIVFDPNYRAKVWPPEDARPHLESIMSRADHVLAGREDIIKLTGIANEADILSYLHSLGLSQVVLKTGTDGAVLSTPAGIERIPGHPLEHPVDRFGAGDCFAAGFIAGLLEDRPLYDAVTLGNAVAGWAIRLPGNIEALPTRREAEQMLTANRFVSR